MARINIAGAFLVALLICNSGIAETRCEYDADGNVTRESYFGVDGKPEADKDGIFEVRTEYGKDGKQKGKTLIYAVAGVKPTREDGIAEIRREYDTDGNVTKTLYFGLDGKPKANKDGIFEIRTEYNKAGKLIRGVMVYAVAGIQPTREDGIAEKRAELDENGNVARVVFFGVDGKPNADKDGVFEIRGEYDKAGKMIRSAVIYAVTGVKPTREDGIAEERFEYDADGNVTREAYFGADGKPKADKDGVFEVRREYDKAGKVIRGAKIYAVAGVKPTREDGIAEKRAERDENGNVAKLSFFGVDGKPKADKEGISEIRYEYDADGNLTKELYFEENGKPVILNKKLEGVSPFLTSVSGVSDDVANAVLGGELVGRILGSVILAYLVMLMLRIAYKLFQGACSVLLNGEWRTEKIRRGLDCVPWWLMFLVFAVQFCTFTEGWRRIPELMCFALTVCLAVVFILWNKQRHGKRTRDEAKTNGASITPVQSAEFIFACPHCGQHISADADMIGTQVDCPACQNNFVLPNTNFGEMNHCSIETTRSKRNIPLLALLCIICAGTIADVIRFFSNLSEGMEMLAQMSNGFVAFITLTSCFISSIVIKWGVSWYLIIKLSVKKYFWLRRATIFWLVSACIACILQYCFNYAWVVLSDVEIGGILADASVFDFIPETSLIAAIVLIVRSRKIRSILAAESQMMEEKIVGRWYKIYGNLAALAIAIVLLPFLTAVLLLPLLDADSVIRNPNQQTNSKPAIGFIALIVFLWVLWDAFRSLAEACNGDVKKSRDEKILK